MVLVEGSRARGCRRLCLRCLAVSPFPSLRPLLNPLQVSEHTAEQLKLLLGSVLGGGHQLQAREACLAAWACGKLRLRDTALLEQVLRVLSGLCNYYTPSYARDSGGAANVHELGAERVPLSLGGYFARWASLMPWNNCLLSHKHFVSTHPSNKSYFFVLHSTLQVTRQARPCLGAAGQQSLSMLGWSMATLGHRSEPELMQELAQAAGARLRVEEADPQVWGGVGRCGAQGVRIGCREL